MFFLTSEKIAKIAAAISVLFILSSFVFFGSGELPDAPPEETFLNPVKPSYIYYLIYAFTLFLLLDGRKISKNSNGFILIFSLVALLHFIWLPFSPTVDQVQRVFVLRVNNSVLVICFFIILSKIRDFEFVLKLCRFVFFTTCVLNVLVIAFWDDIPFRMAVFPRRAAGFYWDPNQCATFIAMCMPLVCYGLSAFKKRVYVAIGFVGIFCTFSREGLLLWVVAIVLTSILGLGERGINKIYAVRKIFVMVIVMLVLGIGMYLFYIDFVEMLAPYLTTDTQSRLLGKDEGSASDRIELAQFGWEMFSQAPIFGNGYGVERLEGTGLSFHNMFLMMAAQFGIVGIIVYFLFIKCVFSIKSNFGIIVGVFIIIESLFTHSFFDISYYGLMLAIYWKLGLIASDRLSSRSRFIVAHKEVATAA